MCSPHLTFPALCLNVHASFQDAVAVWNGREVAIFELSGATIQSAGGFFSARQRHSQYLASFSPCLVRGPLWCSRGPAQRLGDPRACACISKARAASASWGLLCGCEQPQCFCVVPSWEGVATAHHLLKCFQTMHSSETCGVLTHG